VRADAVFEPVEHRPQRQGRLHVPPTLLHQLLDADPAAVAGAQRSAIGLTRSQRA
jgi:hypothetical protein